jgi:hypothetical protein
MGCTEYGVHPTALQALNEVIRPCTHLNASLCKANEAKSHDCGEFEIVPLGHHVVIGVMSNLDGCVSRGADWQGAAIKEEIRRPDGEPDIERPLVLNIAQRHIKHFRPSYQGLNVNFIKNGVGMS